MVSIAVTLVKLWQGMLVFDGLDSLQLGLHLGAGLRLVLVEKLS